MRSVLIPVFTITIFLTAAASAHAQQNYTTGIGIVLGEPTGIDFKHYTSRTMAIDGAMAWSFTDESSFHLHIDALWHNFDVLSREFAVTKGTLPLYFGIGGRVRFDNDETRIGIRFPLGISYMFEDAPIDIFFEIAPIMDLAPETELQGNAGFGFRYWF